MRWDWDKTNKRCCVPVLPHRRLLQKMMYFNARASNHCQKGMRGQLEPGLHVLYPVLMGRRPLASTSLPPSAQSPAGWAWR